MIVTVNIVKTYSQRGYKIQGEPTVVLVNGHFVILLSEYFMSINLCYSQPWADKLLTAMGSG